MLDSKTMFGGAAAIGLVTTCWAWCRTVLWKCASLVVCRVSISANLSEQVGAYLWKTGRRSPFSEHVYSSGDYYVRSLNRRRQVAYESFGRDPLIFWIRGFPIFVRFRGDPNMDANRNLSTDGGLLLTFVRGTFNFERFIVAQLDQVKDPDSPDRFYLAYLKGSGRKDGNKDASGLASTKPPTSAVCIGHRHLGYSADDIGEERRPGESAFAHLALPAEVAELREDLQRWKNSREWYLEKRIPWRRGWGIHGGPGTGKSSLVKALAQANLLPLYVFDIGSMDNGEFGDNWSKAIDCAPAIVLIEDIDSVFQGRNNRLGKAGGGLTFDCLLNTISGVGNADGVFLIITTNHPEDLDPALGAPQASQDGTQTMISTRPGRIDRTLALQAPSAACLRQIARRILSDCPQEIEPAVAAGLGESGAQFQERCAQIALRHYWQAKNNFDLQARDVPL